MSVIPDGILNGIPVPATAEALIDQGMWGWTNKKGWRVVAIHYLADPEKRPDHEEGRWWFREAKRATRTERDWKREYDIDFTVTSGEPFFSGFSRVVHCQPCEYDPDLKLLRGWDFGRSRPACVWGQLGRDGKFRVLYSYMGKNVNIFQFAPLVIAETNIRFPGAKCTDYGDPSGAQETDKGATTVILMEQFQIEIIARFSYQEEGLKIIDQKLLVGQDGTANLLFDPCNYDLINGFAGGYQLDTTATGKDTEGRLKNRPKKDGYYDHLVDALRYILIHVFAFDSMAQGRKHAAQAVGLWTTNAERKRLAEKESATRWADFLS